MELVSLQHSESLNGIIQLPDFTHRNFQQLFHLNML